MSHTPRYETFPHGKRPSVKGNHGLSHDSHGGTSLRQRPLRGTPSPVGDAVVTVAVQSVVFRALPGDRGLGAAANSTSKNNGLPCLTCDLTQGNDEFWGNCTRKESVTLVPGSPPTWAHPHFRHKQTGPQLLAQPRAAQKTRFHRLH